MDNEFVFHPKFFQSVHKDEEEKRQRNFGHSYIGNGWGDFIKFGMLTPFTGRQLCSKFGSNQIRDHRDTKV